VATAGNGLLGMRERLAAHDGVLQVETSPGSGFTVRLRLPMDGGVIAHGREPVDPAPLLPPREAVPREPAQAGPSRNDPLEVP
ncbi:MAG TPA: hypothetical protein PLD19_10855, partial [Luteimonas sp.]|nr:hypothetical protein [Luteimonas sp.]